MVEFKIGGILHPSRVKQCNRRMKNGSNIVETCLEYIVSRHELGKSLTHHAETFRDAMRAQRSGRIVNISSMGGRGWTPLGGWYHATKHSVEVLSDAMRVEVEPFGVKVVVVQPGRIESEWSATAARTLRTSATASVYRDQVEPFAALLEDYGGAASPKVVTDAVLRALSTPKPKRRYATPADARVSIFLHWLLPDAAWEWLTAVGIKEAAKRVAARPGPPPAA